MGTFQLDQKHGWVLMCEGREIADLLFDGIDDPWWVYTFKPRPGAEAACERVTAIASRKLLPETCSLKNRVSDGVLERETCLISGTLASWHIRDHRPHAETVLPGPDHWTALLWLGGVQGAMLSVAFQQLYGLPYVTLLVGMAMGFYLAMIEIWFYQWLRAR